jgi:hypothetical protein
MKMSDYSDLKPGFRWIRMKAIGRGAENGKWMVAEFTGNSPFLRCEIVFTPGEEPAIFNLNPANNPDAWQFGPELEIPSECYIEVKAATDGK